MLQIPSQFMDAPGLLTEKGFTTGNIWYHGTCLSLRNGILEKGILGSGDEIQNSSTRNTMRAIGQNFQERTQPVFLTPSKELAYFWAIQAIKRKRGNGTDEMPMVLRIELPDELNTLVQPDVGAAALLMFDDIDYMGYLHQRYTREGFRPPEADKPLADRMDYLRLLGMAYIDTNIDKELITDQVVTEQT